MGQAPYKGPSLETVIFIDGAMLFFREAVRRSAPIRSTVRLEARIMSEVVFVESHGVLELRFGIEQRKY